MNTKLQDFFYAGYKAIEKDIDNGCNSETLLLKFQEQTKSLKNNEIIDYINYIKSKQYTGSVWNNGHQILSSLKTELNLIEEMHKLSKIAPTFPIELKDDKAIEIFHKAMRVGLIKTNGEFYTWIGETKQLLAYFAEKVNIYLNLSSKLDKDGNKTVNWKLFEIAFKIPNLKSAKNDWMKANTKFTPNGYEKIDKLFE